MFQVSSACSPIDIHGQGSPHDTHDVSQCEPLSLTDLGKVSTRSMKLLNKLIYIKYFVLNLSV